jgi:hypothetical protein
LKNNKLENIPTSILIDLYKDWTGSNVANY